MDILFDNNTNYTFDDNKIKLIENIVKGTIEYENFSLNVEISISIVSSDEIRQLNKKYRNIDKVTDVLSFPLIDYNDNFDNESDEIITLGDIIINIDRAISQASEYGHSLEREIGFLTAHSMLHLLGYDHIKENEEKIMFKKQEEILNNLNLKR